VTAWRIATLLPAWLGLSSCSAAYLAGNTLTPGELRKLEALAQTKQTAVLTVELPGEHALLETPSRFINPDSPGIDKLIAQMEKTARQQGGAGIAAVQLGIPVRLVLLKRKDEDGSERFQPFVNPAIVQRSVKRLSSWEYCLSVPWGYRYTGRPAQISVDYQTVAGKPASITLSGGEAVVFQQEIDHLDGILLSGAYSKAWFIPPQEMDAFAHGIWRQCLNVSQARCDELMAAAWAARATSLGLSIP